MFPFLLRVLTIAGAFTVAAVLTRRYVTRLRENADAGSTELSSDAGQSAENPEGLADSAHDTHRKKRAERKAGRFFRQRHADDVSAERDAPSLPDAGSERQADQQEAEPQDKDVRETERQEKERLEKERQEQDRREKELQEQERLENERQEQERLEREQEKERIERERQEQVRLVHERHEQLRQEKESASALSTDAAAQGARVVLESSRHLLAGYQQPEGLNVDLSLAHFSMDTADRLMTQLRYDEALEKASAVGMLIGMAEMRASTERQLRELESGSNNADNIRKVRAILSEADGLMAEASKSFVSDDSATASTYISHLQAALQKTLEAQSALVKFVV